MVKQLQQRIGEVTDDTTDAEVQVAVLDTARFFGGNELMGRVRVDSLAKLVIAETPTSTWTYHLRQKDEEKYKALCGAKVGWDTELPVSTYGMTTHIGERYCAHCAELANIPLPAPGPRSKQFNLRDEGSK